VAKQERYGNVLAMPKFTKLSSPSLKNGRTIKIGFAASASISRVEGLVMPKDMVRTFEGFEKTGKSHEARRAALKSKYGKMSG
jgi:hypothetical protein